MHVSDKVRKTVVFVGVAHETGFEPYGTAFIMVNKVGEHAYQTIVTAKHVIQTIKAHGKKFVHLRVNTWSDGPRIMTSPIEEWLDHPDSRIDVSVCPSIISREQFDILHLPTDGATLLNEETINEKNIGIGDEVYVAGMFIQRIGEAKNIPIVRLGTIAAMPEEKIETVYGFHDAYLIELRSLGGLSGSPVFVQVPPISHVEGKVKLASGQVEYLMGMLLGHSNLQDQRDAIEIKNPNKKKEDDPDSVIAQVPLNTGIAIVLPISDVIEAIMQPAIQQRRETRLKIKSSKSSFVPDVAVSLKPDIRAEVSSSPPSNGENPTHLEDFKTLLKAASKTPPQDG